MRRRSRDRVIRWLAKAKDLRFNETLTDLNSVTTCNAGPRPTRYTIASKSPCRLKLQVRAFHSVLAQRWDSEELFVGVFTSQQHASASQGRICSDCIAAVLRLKLQIKLSISPSHSVLTPGQPVPALTLSCQASSKIAPGIMPVFKPLV